MAIKAFNKRLSLTTVWLIALALSVSSACAAPTIDPKDDAAHFGDVNNILFWKPDQQVSGFRNMRLLTDTRRIAASDKPWPLPRALRPLDDLVLHYKDQSMTLDEYFKRQSVAGLLVIKDGRIVYERYGLGNTENTLWISFSVSKSVVSMLIGAAVKDGYIKDLDEKVTDYLPRLKGTAYDAVSLRNLMQMASGVAWTEDYRDPEADINQVTWDTLGLYRYLAHEPRVAAPGERFNYNTAEANLAGTLLRSAIGNNLSVWLEEKIWRPFGMESDAYWDLTEPGGGEFGGCCINATLRDYGRLGLFALRDGQLADGTRVLPDGWMAESTQPSAANSGYGEFWWLNNRGGYSASGIFGQGIYVSPDENLVIALHSARPVASQPDDWKWQGALYGTIADALDKP